MSISSIHSYSTLSRDASRRNTCEYVEHAVKIRVFTVKVRVKLHKERELVAAMLTSLRGLVVIAYPRRQPTDFVRKELRCEYKGILRLSKEA